MRKWIGLFALAFLFGFASARAQTIGFFDLVKVGTPQAVKAAIAKGADVNAKDTSGETVLMYAAGNNPDPEVIATLL
jgi:ankyrin repeat protein